eukprot:COSAG01_NODE_1065_length_11883_cov_104.177868_9_plen_529_part_00
MQAAISRTHDAVDLCGIDPASHAQGLRRGRVVAPWPRSVPARDTFRVVFSTVRRTLRRHRRPCWDGFRALDADADGLASAQELRAGLDRFFRVQLTAEQVADLIGQACGSSGGDDEKDAVALDFLSFVRHVHGPGELWAALRPRLKYLLRNTSSAVWLEGEQYATAGAGRGAPVPAVVWQHEGKEWTHVDAAPTLWHVFAAFDTDRDGQLSVAELRAGLSSLGFPTCAARAEDLRAEAAHWETGELGFGEFCGVLGVNSASELARAESWLEQSRMLRGDGLDGGGWSAQAVSSGGPVDAANVRAGSSGGRGKKGTERVDSGARGVNSPDEYSRQKYIESVNAIYEARDDITRQLMLLEKSHFAADGNKQESPQNVRPKLQPEPELQRELELESEPEPEPEPEPQPQPQPQPQPEPEPVPQPAPVPPEPKPEPAPQSTSKLQRELGPTKATTQPPLQSELVPTLPAKPRPTEPMRPTAPPESVSNPQPPPRRQQQSLLPPQRPHPHGGLPPGPSSGRQPNFRKGRRHAS